MTSLKYHLLFFSNAVKQSPDSWFITVKDNVKYTTLKELEKVEKLNINEYSSLNSQNGLNCVGAYGCPEVICDY